MLLVANAKKTMRRTPMDGRKNGKKKRIRVLIGDDHTVVREGLLLLLEGRPDLVVVGAASNGREAVDLWQISLFPSASTHSECCMRQA